MEEKIYKKYDTIVTSTLLNIYNQAKNKEIVLENFNEKDISHLYFFEVSKIAQTCWNLVIVLDMSLLRFLKFKLQNKKLKIKRKGRKQEKSINMNKILSFIQESFNESDTIFSDIYNAYYKKENK